MPTAASQEIVERVAQLSTLSLTLDYGGDPVIADLTLTLPAQGVTALLGRNGSGKSSLLRALARTLVPRSGNALLDGVDVHTLPTRALAKRLGLLPQGPATPAGLTVEALVSLGRFPHRGWLGLPEPGDAAAIDRALDLAGLRDLRHRHVDELSGGQRQRAWIALTLAQESAIILLDEPTTFLDPAHQIEVLSLLRRLATERGTTVLMVLHDLNQAARYADHLCVLHEGRLLAEGTPEEVLTPAILRRGFGLVADVITDPRSGRPLCVPHDVVAEGES